MKEMSKNGMITKLASSCINLDSGLRRVFSRGEKFSNLGDFATPTISISQILSEESLHPKNGC